MSQHTDAKYLFESLESTDLEKAKEIKSLLHENLSANPRDTWMVYGLIDYYLNNNSSRCIEILIEVREPHDKHVFDKLADCLKNNSVKKAALSLLGQVICKQPSWLYKISSHSLLTVLLKLLKTDNDIPILLTALLVLVNLLPMIPALQQPNLVNIFEIFVRLAAWNLQKPSSNIPEVYVTNLHVGVYALFHRLYGMYPCNFLSHLRSHYGERVNLPVFSETIRPMLERVRMHPLLVTASRDNELSMTRWKNMTMHDIIMECAKVSLDMIEGMQQESNQSYIYQTVPATTDDCGAQTIVWNDKFQVSDKPPTKPISESFVSSAVTEVKETVGPVGPPGRLMLCLVKDPSLAAESAGLPESQPSSPLRKFGAYVKFSPAIEDFHLKKDSKPSHSACKALSFTDDSIELEKSDKFSQALLKSTESEENQQSVDEDKYDADKEVSEIVCYGISNSKGASGGLEDSGKEDQVPERLYQRSDSVIHDEAEGIQTADMPGGMDECQNNKMSQVVELVRKVHRIRFNSHCGPPPEIQDILPAQPTIHRSASCPNITRSPSTTSTPSLTESSHTPTASPKKVISPEKKASLIVDMQDDTSLDSQGKETRVPLVRVDNRAEEHQQLLAQAFPPMASCCFHCQNCREAGAVMFEMSPPESLHRHLNLCYKFHGQRDRSGSEEMSWSKGQNLMLYNQLLFERYRRIVYAERNRNLSAKLKKARALEEQNLAMRDQLKLQEKAIQENSNSNALLVKEQSLLLAEKSQSASDMGAEYRKLEMENKRLKFENKGLLQTLEKKEEEINNLKKEWQNVCAQRRAVSLELEEMQVKLADNNKMQIELDRLQKEVVLMGELQQKYRERFSSLSHPSAAKLETTYVIESCKHELQSTKRVLDVRNQQIEAYKARITELESLVAKRDVAVSEQKNVLQKTQEENEEKVQCLENRIKHFSTVLQDIMLYGVLENSDPTITPLSLPDHRTSFVAAEQATPSVPSQEDSKSSAGEVHGATFDHVKDADTREYLRRYYSFSRTNQASGSSKLEKTNKKSLDSE